VKALGWDSKMEETTMVANGGGRWKLKTKVENTLPEPSLS